MYKMESKDSWEIPIDKLMYWKIGSWVKYDSKMPNYFIRLHCDQIIIVDNDRVVESFNMNGRIKGIYKGDVLILIAFIKAQEIRKIKFQIKSDASLHFQKLGRHFPVVCHNSNGTVANEPNIRYRNIEALFKNVLDEFQDNGETLNLPSSYSNFVKLCLLDPTFPQIVHETQKIIQTHLLKKN